MIDAHVTPAAYDSIKAHDPRLAERVVILGSTDSRLIRILGEVSGLQAQTKKLLDEAVMLSGRAVGDQFMLRGRRVVVIRVEAKVAAPFIDGERRRSLSIHTVCAQFRTDGTPMPRNTMTLIERLVTDSMAERSKPATTNPFEHGLKAFEEGARAMEQRQGERRGGGKP